MCDRFLLLFWSWFSGLFSSVSFFPGLFSFSSDLVVLSGSTGCLAGNYLATCWLWQLVLMSLFPVSSNFPVESHLSRRIEFELQMTETHKSLKWIFNVTFPLPSLENSKSSSNAFRYKTLIELFLPF